MFFEANLPFPSFKQMMMIPIFDELRLSVCLFLMYTTHYDHMKLSVYLVVKMCCNENKLDTSH